MWYYSKNGAQLGPIGPAEMESKLKAGEISATDLVWKEGMGDWLPAGQVPEIQALLAPPPPPSEPFGERPAPPVSPYVSSPAAHPRASLPVAPVSQGQAIASMVCGIISLVICCAWFISGPLAIVAVALGHVAVSKAKNDPARFGGKGMARAGLITGYLGLLGSIAMLAFGIWAENLTADQINRMEFFPPEVREQLIQQQEMRERLKQPRP
ncbi:MAG TPA: GYF domain-containing protein [Luteolibacter sp.]